MSSGGGSGCTSARRRACSPAPPPRATTTSPTRAGRDLAPAALAFGGVVAFAAVDGGFFPRWWGLGTIVFACAAAASLLLASDVELPRRSLLLVGSLAALAAFAALSALWATSLPLALLEGERALLYVAASAAAVVVGRRRPAALLAGALAAVVVVACWNLAFRIRDAGEPFDLGNRGVLAEPVGYENALGVLAALGLVLALSLRGLAPARAAAVVPLAAVLAASGSRAAWVALVVGLLVVAALDADTLRAPVPLVAGAAAAALALWSPTLEPDVTTSRAETGALPLALGVLALAALAAALAERWTLPRVRVAPAAALGVAALVAAAGLASAGPERRDYWRAALDQGAHAPVAGDGAGSFARHWPSTRDVSADARDAHSLYLETFGELGLVGLALVALVLAPPLALAPRAPAAAAPLVVFVVHAAFDWDWEMPAVTLAALFCAAALTLHDRRGVQLRTRARLAAAAAATLLAALALPAFLGQVALRAADDSFRAGEAADALARAERAETFLPWSPEPHLLAALVQQQRGFLPEARAHIRRAIAHDESDPRLWRVLATLTEGRERTDALERAEKLDPLGAPPSF